jgi:hypothetical protein
MAYPEGFIEKVKEVRTRLGCGLREAHDLVQAQGMDKIDAKVLELLKSNTPYEGVESKIRQVIRDYYAALDNRQHGGMAQQKAFAKIEEILGMSWRQGASLKKADNAN